MAAQQLNRRIGDAEYSLNMRIGDTVYISEVAGSPSEMSMKLFFVLKKGRFYENVNYIIPTSTLKIKSDK